MIWGGERLGLLVSEGFGYCPCVILDEEAEKEHALSFLCKTKCAEMDLQNHKTAYNALKNIQQPHRDNLKRLGYCVNTDTS